ncbi:hypothetical protein AAG570_009396 [Ranatra chinensis]|uniref:Uncharacterized protein n=1 Tax=Ranatra chinensis TaxID=642074 RepID=A0ABD0YNY8_9HEMI
MFYENKKQETTEIRDPRGARTFLDGIELYMEQRSFHWDMGGFYPGLYMTVGPGSKGGVLEFQLDQRKAADDRSLSTGKLLMKRTLVPLLLGLKLNLVSLTPLLFAALVLITKKAFLLSKLSFLFSGISLLNGAQNQHAAYPHYHKPPLVGGLHGPLGFRDTLIHEPELTIIDRGERTLLRRGI